MSQDALLRRHLLDCLASQLGSLPVTPKLERADWDAWLVLVRMHRLGPLLHWKQAQAQGHDWPGFILDALAASRRQHVIRSLQMRRELHHANALLQEAGIPCMALKGAYLAWHSYPSPELRPIRDLDILVPPEHALRAYDILLASGFEKVDEEHGEPAAILAVHKHLPGIKRPDSSIKLELHAQLFHADEGGGFAHELSRQPGFWSRATQLDLAGHKVHYPAPTDQLLHLLIHSIANHKLNNGPLIFTDVYFLLKDHHIDWPLFWQQASTMRHMPAATLGLQLAEHHWGALPIQWLHALRTPPDTALLEALRNFSLRDFNTVSDVTLTYRLTSGWAERWSVVREQVLPSPRELAIRYPTQHKQWTLPYWYLRRWFDVIVRTIQALRVGHTQDMQNEIKVLRQLDDWLAPPTPPGPKSS